MTRTDLGLSLRDAATADPHCTERKFLTVGVSRS